MVTMRETSPSLRKPTGTPEVETLCTSVTTTFKVGPVNTPTERPYSNSETNNPSSPNYRVVLLSDQRRGIPLTPYDIRTHIGSPETKKGSCSRRPYLGDDTVTVFTTVYEDPRRRVPLRPGDGHQIRVDTHPTDKKPVLDPRDGPFLTPNPQGSFLTDPWRDIPPELHDLHGYITDPGNKKRVGFPIILPW